MDAHEQIADAAAAVIVKGPDAFLVDLDTIAETEVRRAALVAGFAFCGVLRFTNGIASAKTEPGAASIVACACMVQAFAELVAKKSRAGDGTEWLRKIHSLVDPRTAN